MPLLQPYFFASSDGLYHAYRLMEYDIALRDGVWYPRWAPDFFFGLGLPIFNYYAPLTYYLAEAFHLSGAGYIDSLKMLAAVAMALSGIGAYVYTRTLLSPPSSLLAAVVYMYVPYHIVNLYYRGDIAEYVAYTWFPFILWAMRRLAQTRRFQYLFAGSLFYGALILTHNLSAFIFSGFLLVYAAALLWRHTGEPRGRYDTLGTGLWLGATAVLAWALSAFFWLPALAEKSLVGIERLLDFDFHRYFPTLERLLSTDIVHRYGMITTSEEVYAYRLGLMQAVFLSLGLLVLIWRRKRCPPGLPIEASASLLVVAVSLLLIFPESTWVWENAPLLNLAQFPWRFLAFIGLPSALFAGLAVELISARLRGPVVMALAPLVIASSVAGISPLISNVKEADVSPRGSMAFELNYGFMGTTTNAEYLPRWVKQRPATSSIALTSVLGQQTGPLAGRATVGIEAVEVERAANRISYRVQARRGGELVANVLYFPGWVALVDGRRVESGVDEPSGLIKIAVPEGEHTINLRFEETRLRTTSNLISALALFTLLGLMAISRTVHSDDLANQKRPPFATLKGRLRAAFTRTATLRYAQGQSPGRSYLTGVLAKIGIVLAAVLLWLLARSAYDAAYARPTPHPFSLVMNFADEVLIEGYDLHGVEPAWGSAMRVLPGRSFEVTIFWRLLGNGEPKGYKPFVRLANSFDHTWAYAESATTQAGPDAGRDGTIATTLSLSVAPTTPPGIYHVELGFQSGATNRALDVRGVQVVPLIASGNGTSIGPIIVGKGPVITPTGSGSIPAMAALVNFDDKLQLLDLSLREGAAPRSGRPGAILAREATEQAWEIRAGETVQLDLLWQATGKTGDDLTITARLVGADRMLWTVRDSQPADGTYPTSFWSAGETVRDQLNLTVPAETPPGRYELQLEVVSRAGPLSVLDQNLVPTGPTFRVGTVLVRPAERPADMSKVKTQRRINAALYDGLSIVGYGLGRPELQPGEQLNVDVLWAAAQAITRDLVVRLELVDNAGRALAKGSHRPVGDAYPTSAWRQGEVIRGQYALTLPATAPAGDGEVVVALADADNRQALSRLILDRVRVLPRLRSFTAAPARPLVKKFDGKIRLLGFDVGSGARAFRDTLPEVAPGDTLVITAHWQAVTEMSTSYTVFAQVLNAAGRLVAQHDAPPQGGKAPTTAWVQDEVVADAHPIPVPTDLPEGEYVVIAGIYDAVTGKRLPVEGGGDFVVLTHLRLVLKGLIGRER